jgi:hypothetical protein
VPVPHVLYFEVLFGMVIVIHSILMSIVSEHLFNLKFAAKDLERNAKKCEKQEKEEKVKLKKVT